MLSKCSKPWKTNLARGDEEDVIEELSAKLDALKEQLRRSDEAHFEKNNNNTDLICSESLPDSKKQKYSSTKRGSRDRRESNVPFVVYKNCKCGKACLSFLKEGQSY